MIETSQGLKDAMRTNQTVSARLSILNGTDLESYGYTFNKVESILEDNGYTKVGPSTGYYNIPQLNDMVINETGNYGIFEGEGISLSGFNVISPTAKNNQYGWIGAELSLDNGVFSSIQRLNWYVKNYKDNPLTIVFSKIRNEYAKSFKVTIEQYFEEEPDPINPEEPTITTYTENNYNKPEYKISNVKKAVETFISIEIYEWSKNNARAKITELYFGDMLILEDNEISNISVSKAVSLTNDSLEAKTLSFMLADELEEFNIFQSSGRFLIVAKNSRVTLELGGTVDEFIYYTKIDEFLINDITKQPNSIEVTVQCYGRLYQYNNVDFTEQNYELNSAVDLLIDASEINSHKIISSEIQTENQEIRTEYGECKYIEGLQKIATAIRANVIETINNDVLITRIAQSTPVSKIELENCMTNPEIQKLDKPKAIFINKYVPQVKAVEEIFNQTLVLNTDTYNVFKYIIEHTAPPYTATRSIKSDITESGYITADITSTVVFRENKAYWTPMYGDESIIKITGSKVELMATAFSYDVDVNGTDEITIDNPSINTETQLLQVFHWLLSNYNKNYEFKVEVQDIFTYELGDTVEIDTGIYIYGKMLTKNAIVTGIEYEYNGALHYYLILRGA